MIPIASLLSSPLRINGWHTGIVRSLSTYVRLTKRMGELNICSRREADRWISQGLVSVNGKVAEIGEKIPSDLPANQIHISRQNSSDHDDETSLSFKDGVISNDLTVAIVLNKPAGYVSGQAEHGHQPAIRLVTRDRLWTSKSNNTSIKLPQNSWKHFAPAGRLDLDSTGLLVFSRSGVISKMLVHHDSRIEKEYIVEVAPALQETRLEHDVDENFVLPPPTLDLSILTRGGGMLLGEHKPLKPCQASWLKKGAVLRVILKEGRKRQIRRACRELLGFHVISLRRIRVGPIKLGDLPEGSWRPLTNPEIERILASTNGGAK